MFDDEKTSGTDQTSQQQGGSQSQTTADDLPPLNNQVLERGVTNGDLEKRGGK
jgi:hypothetical protein